MYEFDVNKMSEEELLEAANKIFTLQEQDFKKIKSEKWYQTLFHAITLNQDGKKYMVRGISSLAKLQQLFMGIYVKNYRKTHEQLDEVIEAVTKNSEAIKKLYGKCVLNLEEQQSLESLDDQDAEILALFLGEYRDENGSVPASVKDYNMGVLNAINQKSPIGKLDNHQIRRLKAPKVVYRCFMEQCAVDGTIDTGEWSDKIYDDLNDFEISERTKKEIKESVKYEAEIAGINYFIGKYKKEKNDVLDIDFEIDIERSEKGEKDNKLNEDNLVRKGFHCKLTGVNSKATDNSGTGLRIGQMMVINGTTCLSNIIKFNDGGCVHWIKLVENPSFSLWGYKYEIEVMAEGPHGLGTGSGYLRFTDKTGDTYSLSITDSSKKKHVVDYKSSDPVIIQVEWSNNSF